MTNALADPQVDKSGKAIPLPNPSAIDTAAEEFVQGILDAVANGDKIRDEMRSRKHAVTAAEDWILSNLKKCIAAMQRCVSPYEKGGVIEDRTSPVDLWDELESEIGHRWFNPDKKKPREWQFAECLVGIVRDSMAIAACMKAGRLFDRQQKKDAANYFAQHAKFRIALKLLPAPTESKSTTRRRIAEEMIGMVA